ncbi:hypothetical protein Taro_041721 [Colocasia esculenta]|uniref:Uncharacterized protein n=1 Tax=Colocasia esculenta TaxID=4460 RepID=A0A843WC68_COLES|nr:hypothetical protein [Colocasia esculenta]
MWRPIAPNVKESESYDHKNDDMSKQDATPISAHQEHGDLPPQISELNSELYPSLFDPQKVVENANPHEEQMVDVSSIWLGAENQQPPANNVAQRKAHQMFDDMQCQKSELVPVNALDAPDRKPHTAGQVHVEAAMLPHEDTPTAAPSSNIGHSQQPPAPFSELSRPAVQDEPAPTTPANAIPSVITQQQAAPVAPKFKGISPSVVNAGAPPWNTPKSSAQKAFSTAATPSTADAKSAEPTSTPSGAEDRLVQGPLRRRLQKLQRRRLRRVQGHLQQLRFLQIPCLRLLEQRLVESRSWTPPAGSG